MTDATIPGPVSSATDADARVGLTAESISPRRQAFLRFKEHKAAVVSVFILAFILLFVLLSPITARYGVNEQVFDISKGPNQNLAPRAEAWMGTDSIGRDLYTRIIYATRVSVVLGFVSAIIITILGVAIGALAALRGGLFDDIMMRVTDVFIAFPLLVSLLVMRNLFAELPWLKPIVGEKSSIRFLVFLFAVFGWMSVARLVRAQVLALKEREFIEASRAIGAGNVHILVRHLIPNSIGPLLVSLSLSVVGVILGEATLALFGYGPDPVKSTSLGVLIADARKAADAGYWWLLTFPFATLLALTLTISFIGDGLRDATDPKSSQGRA